MIAGRGNVVLHRVHRIDDGLRLPFVVAAEERRERISLEQVTRIDDNEVAGIAGAQRFERRRGARQPAGRRGITDIVPPEYPAVDVGRRDDDDVGGIGGALERQE